MDKKKIVSAIDAATSVTTDINATSLIKLETIDGMMVATGTNLEQTVRSFVEDESVDFGPVYVHGKTTAQSVKNAPGDKINIKLVEKTERVSIKGSAQKGKGYSIQYSTEESLTLPESVEEKYTEIDNFFKKMFMVDYAIADEDSRYVFNGACIDRSKDGVFIVGTDGRRMSVITCDIPDEVFNESDSIIIPHKAIESIKKYTVNEDKIKLYIENSNLYVKTDKFEIISRLIDGTFPPWKDVIPKVENGYNHICLDRSSFYGSIKRATSLLLKGRGRMFLSCKDKHIVVSVTGADHGDFEEEVEIVNGETFDFDIALNAQYMEEVISPFSSETMSLYIKDKSAPVKISYDDCPEFTGVVMPMKV